MNTTVQSELVASALRIFEIIGVLAFAASGLIEAARKKFDIFGVVLIAFIAAFGGGTLHDHQPYALLAFAGAWMQWGRHSLGLDTLASIAITTAAIILVRFASILFKWKLPAWRL
ncbi:MAG: hypothetical protein RIS80_366 [Actinomycetota bacterium]